MDGSTQFEVSGSDAGLEENGVGGEIRVEIGAGHEIKGGDCFIDSAHIRMVDQTALERLEADDIWSSSDGGFMAGVEVGFERRRGGR